MAKVKVKVLNAVVDGKGEGEVIEVEAKAADQLEKVGYVERVNKKQEDKKEDDK